MQYPLTNKAYAATDTDFTDFQAPKFKPILYSYLSLSSVMKRGHLLDIITEAYTAQELK